MFQQQAPRKERSKLAVFSAPANMLSFRSSSNNGSSNSNNGSSLAAPNQSSQQQQQQQNNASPSKSYIGGTSGQSGSSAPQPQNQSQQPSSSYVPSKMASSLSLPGPGEQLSDIPNASFTSPSQHRSPGSVTSNTSSRVPQSKRPPLDPLEAPAVSFRSTLTPPHSATIPDIPYGQGRGPSQKKSRTASTSSSSVAKPRVFTPSDTQRRIRVNPGQQQLEESRKMLQDNTARNSGNSDYNLVTVASSNSSHPATSLVTPSAPLTVNATVVRPQGTRVTQIDPQHLQEWQSTGNNSATGDVTKSPSKQPTKSAMKGGNMQARSWADLVRPMNNVQIAEQAVKNMGFSESEIAAKEKEEQGGDKGEAARAANEAAKKKKVSIALPNTASAGSSATSTPAKTSSGDKSPKHVSPPPATSAAANGDAATVDNSDNKSLASNATGGSALFSSIMSKKKTLEEILAGVENSKSTVVLYPRGLVNTGNACFMNSILQTLLFTGPFYNLISLIGHNTAEDLSGKTPLLDAMVSYLSEFKTSNPEKEFQLELGRSYEEQPNKDDAFIPSIIYHALNKNGRFAQMGFVNPSSSSTSLSNGMMGGGSSSFSHNRQSSNAPMSSSKYANSNHLSQEDAQEFLGFFLDTIHEELLIKTEQFDKQVWEKASKGYRAGMDSLSRQSVNGAGGFESISAPPGPSNSSVVNPSGASTNSASAGAGLGAGGSIAGDDEDWLEVGQKGRTATTRTTEQQESAITRIFGGQLRSVLRCPGQKDSVTLEPFMSLQLEIQQPNVYSVEDALSFISTPETISDVTNRNNLKVEATKQLFIETLPPVLILHLKRFIYDPKAGGVLKSHKVISYGNELEVPKECLAPNKKNALQSRNRYRLNGVVYHHGKSAAGGHYTISQRQNNGRWINIDDTTITPVAPEDAATDRDRESMRMSLPSASALRGVPEKSAYLLFYQRI